MHLRAALLLFLLHPRLLVGGAFVRNDARLCGLRHFGIESHALRRLGLLLFGGCEDQPHRTREEQPHKRVHEHLSALLPLLRRKSLFRLLLFRGESRIFVLFHNSNIYKG